MKRSKEHKNDKQLDQNKYENSVAMNIRLKKWQ